MILNGCLVTGREDVPRAVSAIMGVGALVGMDRADAALARYERRRLSYHMAQAEHMSARPGQASMPQAHQVEGR
jgi:hypothetical protein